MLSNQRFGLLDLKGYENVVSSKSIKSNKMIANKEQEKRRLYEAEKRRLYEIEE